MSTKTPKPPFAWIHPLPPTYYSNVYTFVGSCISAAGLVLIVLAIVLPFLTPRDPSLSESQKELRCLLPLTGSVLLFAFPIAERLRKSAERRSSDRFDALCIAAIQKYGTEYERTYFAQSTSGLAEKANSVLVRTFPKPVFENGFEQAVFSFGENLPHVPGKMPAEEAEIAAAIKKLLPDASINAVMGKATAGFPNGLPAWEIMMVREGLPMTAHLQRNSRKAHTTPSEQAPGSPVE